MVARRTISYWAVTMTDDRRDGVTEDQKPIIARHPKCPNLLIAGGASYTHAKDFPNVGRTVSNTLNGYETHASFGWDPPSAHRCFDNQPALRTGANFEDLELEASKDERVQLWKETRSDWII